MDLQIAGKVALVVAASRGLGKASAKALAQEGARLSISSRGNALSAAADEIRQETGAEVIAIPADVTVASDVERLVRETLEHFGQIDILVINAGGPPAGSFLDFTAEDWEAAVQLTLMSAVRFCYAVLPQMLEQGSGSIVAIESVSVKQPVDNLILSNSIRMAVIGLLKSLANEFGPKGIRVNSVNPTFTWTERVASLLQSRASSKGTNIEQEKAQTLANIPLGRMGDADEFGRTVAWLASPAASFIHGHALMFDGGATKSPL